MASDEPRDDRCGAELQSGRGHCERLPMNAGRCYMHGGAGDSGAPAGNVNAMTHGLYAQRSNYYQSLDSDEQAFIESIADGWIDNAPFDRDNQAKVNRVYKIAVDEHKMWRAQDYFADEGLITEETVMGEDGPEEIRDEHPGNIMYDRLSRTTIKELKELGCLDDPDSQQADATESLAKKLSGIADEDD